MELRRMRSFISFQPGEQRSCVGCHETQAAAPSASRFPAAVHHDPVDPLPPPWGAVAMSFLRDIQPIFDRHCVRCHSGLKPAAGMDFFGGLTTVTSGQQTGRTRNVCYDTLFNRKLIARSDVNEDARITMPLAFGSHKSKLIESLRKSPRWKELSGDERLRLITWIDLNGPYHDGFINKRPERPVYDLPADRQLEAAIAAVHAKRCQGCHKVAEVTRLGWIDLHQPQRSLFLAAPLAKTAGGSGKCSPAVYQDRSDADYQALCGLVGKAVERAWQFPRRDLKSVAR